jgi:hypothetical protein
MTDIGYLSLLDCARLIRTREISSTELVKRLLGRIKAPDNALNAFIAVNEDGVIEEAKNCDREIASGGARWRPQYAGDASLVEAGARAAGLTQTFDFGNCAVPHSVQRPPTRPVSIARLRYKADSAVCLSSSERRPRSISVTSLNARNLCRGFRVQPVVHLRAPRSGAFCRIRRASLHGCKEPYC